MMDDLQWIWPDRRDLYHACIALSDPHPKTANVSEAAETVLNDLELFDDPHQGRGAWLFDDELQLAADLATMLHAVAGLETSGDWGEAIMCHELWPAISANAGGLLETIERNGQGSAKGVH